MVAFDKYIAIDWSGDKNTPTEKIQIAEYDPASGTVSIVASRTQSTTGWNRWSREEMLGYVRRSVTGKRVLIGFDFAFGYPYCDIGAYFPPNASGKPAGVRDLWQTVEQVCCADGDFYGGAFYTNADAPFRDFYKYRGFEGNNYPDQSRRCRLTDQQAKNAFGVLPNSAFSCYGQRNVGTGSLAGMRFLLRLRQEANAAIWPFDAPLAPHGSAVVEIYPRLFRNDAEKRCRNQQLPKTVRGLLKCYDATLVDACEKWSDDERDALVSAAGMAWFARQPETWQAPTLAAKYEGWIFGVR